ncbi:hypothetical protein F3K43_16390 [Streptomyces sp. LBUM 1476]|nr:hypothetical protein [Streptomyces sp. LBUM 1476]
MTGRWGHVEGDPQRGERDRRRQQQAQPDRRARTRSADGGGHQRRERQGLRRPPVGGGRAGGPLIGEGHGQGDRCHAEHGERQDPRLGRVPHGENQCRDDGRRSRPTDERPDRRGGGGCDGQRRHDQNRADEAAHR